MNHVLLCSGLLLLVFAPLLADPEIPASAWEQHPEGVSLAMILVNRTENGTPKSSIEVHIKNISNTIKYLPSNINDWAVQIFYIDSEGKKVPLRDYSIKPRIFLAPAMPDSRAYQPAEVSIRTIDLSQSELTIIKKFKVECRFYISAKQIGGYKLIESSPKLLANAP